MRSLSIATEMFAFDWLSQNINGESISRRTCPSNLARVIKSLSLIAAGQSFAACRNDKVSDERLYPTPPFHLSPHRPFHDLFSNINILPTPSSSSRLSPFRPQHGLRSTPSRPIALDVEQTGSGRPLFEPVLPLPSFPHEPSPSRDLITSLKIPRSLELI